MAQVGTGPPGFRSPTAFRRLGLRTNPFVLVDHDELVRRFVPPQWVDELAEQSWDGLVISGPGGVGKTTAAHMLAQRLESRGVAPIKVLRLHGEHAAWPERPEGAAVVVIDSVQRLGRRARWRLGGVLCRYGRVVLVGQEDVTRGIRLARHYVLLRVTPPSLSVDEVVDTYARHVRASLVDLAEAQRQNPRSLPMTLSQAQAEALCLAAGGNRFRLVRVLYHGFEAWVDGHVQDPVSAQALAIASRLVGEEDRDALEPEGP